MAAAARDGSGSPMPGPSTPKRRNTSDGPSNVLRNSCEACAASKVKCSGCKPRCLRCVKRGLRCDYILAKRAGRKPNGSASTAGNSNAEPSQSASEGASAPEAAYASPRGTASELSDIWGDLNPLDRSLFAEMSDLNETSSGFTPSFPLDLPAFDAPAPTASMTSTDGLFSPAIGSGFNFDLSSLPDATLQASNDTAAALFAFPPTTGATGLATPVTRQSLDLQRSPSTDQPCSCLFQALALMRRLSELLCSTNVAVLTTNEADAIRTVRDVITQNHGATEAATGMLNCRGRHDGYLLVVICLTAFKILELFEAILPGPPTQQKAHGRPLSMAWSIDSGATGAAHGDGYRIEGGDWARQSTHAILHELHNVRRLTGLLSEKLRSQTMASTTTSSTRTSGGTTPDATDDRSTSSKGKGPAVVDGEARLPLSNEVYRQLELDLTNRVRLLLQHIVSRLRGL